MKRWIVLPILLIGVGCNSQDSGDLQRDASNFGKTATRAATNATVAGKVNAALALRKGVDLKGLHVEAEGGTVTVGGHVRTALEKKTVLDVTNNTVGVDRVIDKIKVEAARPGQK